MDNNEKEVINKKILITIAGIALVVVFIFGLTTFKRNKTIQQADSLISIERYEEGIVIYDNLLSKKYIPQLITKRESAVQLMESKEIFEKGVKAFDDNDSKNAIKYLSKVSENDNKRYKEAEDKLKDLEELTDIKVDELIEKNKIDKANAEKQSQQNQKVANVRKKDEAQSIASNLRKSYRSIISEGANLRDAPTIKSNVYNTVPRGSEVYIIDTQIESSDRIWCRVDTDYGSGWISYNTMNYTIQ